MHFDRLLLTAFLSLTFLQMANCQYTMLVDVSASIESNAICGLGPAPVIMNEISLELQNGLGEVILEDQESVDFSLIVSEEVELIGTDFSGSLIFNSVIKHLLSNCEGEPGLVVGDTEVSAAIVSEVILVDFNGVCTERAYIFEGEGAIFTLTFNFKLVMDAPTVTPVSDDCNTDFINLQVTSTSPTYTWQVLNPAGSWVNFRTNASNAIVATRQELQTFTGNGAYENRNVRVVESGCLTNRFGPSSAVFNFHVPAPSISFIKTDQTCNNSKNGSVAVTISSASPETVDDFIVYLHDPAVNINPETGYSPAIVEELLTNLSYHEFDNLGVNDSPKAYYVSVVNKTINDDLYGTCRSVTPNFAITNPSAIGTTFNRVPKNGFDISCNGGSNGEVTAVPSGGVGGFHSFSWQKGGVNLNISNARITNRNVGTYVVSFRDGNNCLGSRSVGLTQPPVLSVSIQSNNEDIQGHDVSCLNPLSGSISAIANGGAGGRNFKWSGGPAVATYSGLGVGNYVVTVTDGNSCIANSNITLTAPPPITFSINELTGIDCPGSATGSLAVNNVMNAIGGITYAWSNGGANIIKQNLSAGIHSVTLTDTQGCTAFAQRSLTDPLPYTLNITPQSNYDGNHISCSSAADGVLGATLLDTNSDPAIGSFSWFKGGTPIGVGATASNLNEGSYRVVADYGNACTVEQSYFLAAPEPYQVAISVQSNYNGSPLSCNEASDGVLSVTLFDDNTNITEVEYYEWSRNGVSIASGESINSISNLNEGEYSVITTYSGGCIANGNITLTDPDPLVVKIQPDTDYNGYLISCVGEINGALLASVTGGTTGAYTYVWNTGIESSSITNIGAGAYSITVTDINNCSAVENVIVEDPPELTAFIELTSDFHGFPISCTGQSDGALLATATGGTDHYTFLWNTGVNTDLLSNIPAGDYEVIATDENGCTAQTNLSILNPPQVEVSISIISDYNGQSITCAGEANGRLEAFATGGTNVFAYSWNIGTLEAVQNNLAAGLYEVVATDENGCQANTQQELTEPIPVLASLTNFSDYNGFGVSCAELHDGFIEVAGVGGTGVFSFNWTDQTETSNLLTDVGIGIYIATITDNNGCSDEVSHQITEPTLLTLAVVDKNDITCFGGNNGSITVEGNGGVNDYVYAINLLEQTSESNFATLIASDYTLHVYDANNCYATISETLLQPSQIEIDFEDIEPAFCNDPRGSASANVTGGVMNYSFQWKNSVSEVIDEDSSIENLAVGLYSLRITDGNNCEASKILGVEAIDGPIVIVDETIPAKCSYSADGSITMQVIEGDGPFTFQWQDGQNSATAINLPQGEYFVTVHDVNNCQTVSSGIVSAPSSLAISLIELKPPTCYGYNDGSIEVLGNGGTAPYAYDWGIFQGSIFPARSKGNNYLTLRDANQCTTQASYAMPEPTPLSFSLVSRVLPKCHGECNGQIQVIAAGGNGEYEYNWDSGSELAIATNLCSESHTVSVQDLKGCTLQRTYALGQPTQLTPRLLALSSPDCHNGCNGKLEVDATGGVGDYTYSWSNGNTNTNIKNLCAGTYTVIIQDENECEIQQTHQLLNPEALSIELGESRTICEGQSHSLSVAGTWSSYQWSSNVNFQSEAAQVVISIAGQYWLTVTNDLGCVARDTFLLTTSTDLLEASFIIPSEANVQDTVVMIDITWPMAESISWQLPPELVLLQNLNEVVYGKFQHAGVYNVGLHAQLGGCYDEVIKAISILGTALQESEQLLGYEEFVKVFEIFPNPTQGNFNISLQFVEESFATLSIWEVLTGKVVKQINLEEDQDFSVKVDLQPLPTGAYVLRMDYRGGFKYLRFVVN